MSTAQTLVLLLLTAATAAAYAAACRWWPYARCRRCNGTGRLASPGGRHWRTCRRCGGSGRRVRLGRRLFTAGRHHTTTD